MNIRRRSLLGHNTSKWTLKNSISGLSMYLLHGKSCVHVSLDSPLFLRNSMNIFFFYFRRCPLLWHVPCVRWRTGGLARSPTEDQGLPLRNYLYVSWYFCIYISWKCCQIVTLNFSSGNMLFDKFTNKSETYSPELSVCLFEKISPRKSSCLFC